MSQLVDKVDCLNFQWFNFSLILKQRSELFLHFFNSEKEWAIHLLGHILTGDLKPQISGRKNIDKIIDQYSLDRWKIGLNGG